MDRSHRAALAGHGRPGEGLRPAGRPWGGTVMIALEVLYGFGGLCAVLLLAYLVYALICAEEF